MRLALEYDGGTHRSTLAEDNRRQNRLVDAGIRLLRFTSGDIFNTPDSVVALVRAHQNVHHIALWATQDAEGCTFPRN
jgi:very-short-patch-repair endonuclease